MLPGLSARPLVKTNKRAGIACPYPGPAHLITTLAVKQFHGSRASLIATCNRENACPRSQCTAACAGREERLGASFTRGHIVQKMMLENPWPFPGPDGIVLSCHDKHTGKQRRRRSMSNANSDVVTPITLTDSEVRFYKMRLSPPARFVRGRCPSRRCAGSVRCARGKRSPRRKPEARYFRRGQAAAKRAVPGRLKAGCTDQRSPNAGDRIAPHRRNRSHRYFPSHRGQSRRWAAGLSTFTRTITIRSTSRPSGRSYLGALVGHDAGRTDVFR